MTGKTAARNHRGLRAAIAAALVILLVTCPAWGTM